MAQVQDYCFKHASYYSGWQCPLCAKSREAGTATTAAGATRGGRAGTAATVSGAPAQQASEERSREAMLMLQAGSPADALAQCERALELDGNNLEAHVVGVRACQALRDRSGEIDFFDHALRVLASEAHRSSPESYHAMLGASRDSAQVRQVVAAFVSARAWRGREALPFVQALASRGLPSEASAVLDELPQAEESLLILGFRAHLAPSAATRAGFDAYLSRARAEDRDRLLAEYRELDDAHILPVATLLRVRDALLKRYDEWQGTIFPLLEADARRVAASRVGGAASGRALTVAGQVLGAGVLLFAVLAVATGGGWFLLLGGLIAALLASGGAYAWTRQAEIDRHAPPLVPGILDAMVQNERARWEALLGDRLGPEGEAPEGDAAAETDAGPGPCPACGASVAADATLCPSCGSPLEAPQRPAGPTPDSAES